MNTKITALGDIQTNLGNVIGLIPDHHNKAGIIIKKIKVWQNLATEQQQLKCTLKMVNLVNFALRDF